MDSRTKKAPARLVFDSISSLLLSLIAPANQLHRARSGNVRTEWRMQGVDTDFNSDAIVELTSGFRKDCVDRWRVQCRG